MVQGALLCPDLSGRVLAASYAAVLRHVVEPSSTCARRHLAVSGHCLVRAHAHLELGAAACGTGGGEEPVAAKAASSLSVSGRTGPGRRGSRQGEQRSHLSTYLPTENLTAGRATTVTQTGFMIIYEDRPSLPSAR